MPLLTREGGRETAGRAPLLKEREVPEVAEASSLQINRGIPFYAFFILIVWLRKMYEQRTDHLNRQSDV